ncbi:DUF4153 domain-containing protein [Novosphingobium sp. 9U]|uniref:DUF4153 domain-containing protein n=1 Tax=Novosphingobium sp. 9U TaxID=2653158 RepID=UPI0012F46E09|nr:DUF4173 domain-containing protein [Novosphingobium sp. 9U]VWX51290.1 conserved membrane hypothetical protein [Novosphingobium sp. 9U]
MRLAAMPLTARFRWKLLPAVLVAALGDWLFYQRDFYAGGFGLFALGLLAALVAGRRAILRAGPSLAATAGAALFGIALLYDPSLLAWALFWIAAGMATLLPATARFDDGWRWAQRLIWQALRAPFGPLLDAVRLAKLRSAGRTRRTSARIAFSVLALPLAGSAVILALFAAANPLIESALSTLVPHDWNLGTAIARSMLWSVCFIMAWSLLRPSLARRLLSSVPAIGEQGLPGVSVASVTVSLVLFNLIFAAQNLLDIAYLWGIAPMPQRMTMAQYAHRGAYPLIVTALLAALFVLVALRPGSTTAQAAAIRRLVTLWIAQNIFLVGSSMLRTIDYVEAYSLTRLRIAALLWMGLVAFGLAAICWRTLRGRSAPWLINVNLGAAALVLTVCCFVDLGAIAARWNVTHAREVGGQGAALDLCYLGELQDSALLSMLALERRPGLPTEFANRVRSVRTRVYVDLDRHQAKDWSLLRQWRLSEARERVQSLPARQLGTGPRGCDGALLPPPPVVAAPPIPHPTTTPTPALTGRSR